MTFFKPHRSPSSFFAVPSLISQFVMSVAASSSSSSPSSSSMAGWWPGQMQFLDRCFVVAVPPVCVSKYVTVPYLYCLCCQALQAYSGFVLCEHTCCGLVDSYFAKKLFYLNINLLASCYKAPVLMIYIIFLASLTLASCFPDWECHSALSLTLSCVSLFKVWVSRWCPGMS